MNNSLTATSFRGSWLRGSCCTDLLLRRIVKRLPRWKSIETEVEYSTMLSRKKGSTIKRSPQFLTTSILANRAWRLRDIDDLLVWIKLFPPPSLKFNRL